MHPELADDETIKDYWQRIMIAYTYNQLKDLQELEMLVSSYLEKSGRQVADLDIADLEDKIAAAEEEISNIISTNPYLYKMLLDDPLRVRNRKQEYRDEIAHYEMYSLQLDEVLGTFEMERGKLS